MILNIVAIIGIWRIFYFAELYHGILVIPDLTMNLEIYLAFPYMVLINSLFIIALIYSRRKTKIDKILSLS